MAAEPPGPRLHLSVQMAVRDAGLPARSTVRRWVLRALQRDAALTVRFVGAAEGRRLNRDFRGKDCATNVLTFGYETAGLTPSTATESLPLTGDIVLCVPVLRREVRGQQKSLVAHCAHLTIHGALHLQGHDHQTSKDAKVMETLETKLLASLGYGDPYAPNEGKKKRER